METTLVNLAIVTIVGNLALLTAWALGGILWFAFGDYIRKER